MNYTIRLEGQEAVLLGLEAAARGKPPEETARDLLANQLRKPESERDWERLNTRRVELIHQKVYGSLTEGEQAELDRLQQAAIERVAPLDKRLLAMAEEFKRQAEALPDAPKP
ncbi:MAG: hypothetical protein K2W96_01250 [Gemmataceae bacterium]|nr:hypothetical protein [Gemmataceae bacterium]